MPLIELQPFLSIIIVSFNTSNLTLQAVKAVIAELKSSKTLHQASEIIVVDNHSQDDSVAQLKQLQKQTPQLTIIETEKNLGFAKANNLGIKQSQGNYILLLNSDTIVQPGALTQLVRTFEINPVTEVTAALSSQQGKLDKLGILAATLLYPDGSWQAQGGQVPNLITLMMQMFFLDDLPVIGPLLPSAQETGRTGRLRKKLLVSITTQPQQKGWVGGTAMMIRKEVLQDIELLDENIFMYGEDMEFCLRARKHHWDIALDPQAKVVHLGSASSSAENAILGEFKAYLYIWSKHKPHWQIPLVKGILYLGAQLRRFVFGTILKDQAKAQAYQKAKNLLL